MAKRTRPDRKPRNEKADGVDANDLHTIRRMDMVLELFGAMVGKGSILAALTRGTPDIPPVSMAHAYRIYNVALDTLRKEEGELDLVAKARRHKARLESLAKAARNAQDFNAAQAALDRVAILEGLRSENGEVPVTQPAAGQAFTIVLPPLATPETWAAPTKP